MRANGLRPGSTSLTSGPEGGSARHLAAAALHGAALAGKGWRGGVGAVGGVGYTLEAWAALQRDRQGCAGSEGEGRPAIALPGVPALASGLAPARSGAGRRLDCSRPPLQIHRRPVQPLRSANERQRCLTGALLLATRRPLPEALAAPPAINPSSLSTTAAGGESRRCG